MSTRKGTFHKGSIPGRVLAWFRENPEEDLMYHDIARKFDVSKGAAYAAVRRLREMNLVECVPAGSGFVTARLVK